MRAAIKAKRRSLVSFFSLVPELRTEMWRNTDVSNDECSSSRVRFHSYAILTRIIADNVDSTARRASAREKADVN